ncbi:MAG: 16S rRNA processing protein RimM [Methylibium sp. NZG]|nr:MAG: 16S rRNA processing protein RimM [Methylibium sp. NZG]
MSGGPAEPAWPDDAVEVGRIAGAWGIKGWLKIQPFASDPQALFSSRAWFVKPPEVSGVQRPVVRSPATQAGYPALLKVTQSKEHGDGVVAQVEGVETRNDAEALRGARLFVGRSSFPTADKDEFYWVDLIGLAVVNRGGDALGTVIGLIDTGPHSVLRVLPIGLVPSEASPEAERLIPFVAAYVDDVSLPLKRITVDWGLEY